MIVSIWFGSIRLSALFSVLSQDVEPQPNQQEHVGYEDDGVGPSRRQHRNQREGEHRRGEELQRVDWDVQQRPDVADYAGELKYRCRFVCFMVGQLQRSVARRKADKALSSETIIAFLEEVSSVNDKGEILFEKYTMGCKLALACSTESLTGMSIPVQLMSKGNVLELFDGIEGHKNVFQSLPEASILSTYISENKQVLSEEDLGGISELFTGHQATWEDGVVKLVHNPKRRGIGKSTPPTMSRHTCQQNVRRPCFHVLIPLKNSIPRPSLTLQLVLVHFVRNSFASCGEKPQEMEGSC